MLWKCIAGGLTSCLRREPRYGQLQTVLGNVGPAHPVLLDHDTCIALMEGTSYQIFATMPKPCRKMKSHDVIAMTSVSRVVYKKSETSLGSNESLERWIHPATTNTRKTPQQTLRPTPVLDPV